MCAWVTLADCDKPKPEKLNLCQDICCFHRDRHLLSGRVCFFYYSHLLNQWLKKKKKKMTSNVDNEGNQTVAVNIPEDNSIIPHLCWEREGFICCFLICAELAGSLTVVPWINPVMAEWSTAVWYVIWLLQLQMIRWRRSLNTQRVQLWSYPKHN